MKKLKFPYANALPVLVVAFILFKLIDNANLSLGGLFSLLYNCLSYFVFGAVTAYLLNPAMVYFEKLILSQKDTPKTKKLKRIAVIALIFLLLIGAVTIFVVAIIPAIREGVQELMNNIPAYTLKLEEWFGGFTGVQYADISERIESLVNDSFGVLYNILQELDLSTIGSAVTTGVASFATGVLRFVFGLIISVYMLYSKETVLKGIKKLIYALFGGERGDSIIDKGNKINAIFKNFVTSKILQSIILFVVGLVVLVIIGVPLAPLIALVIAVTNMIPYFGPYLGAIPSILLVMLYEPIMGLWVLLYVLGVQVLDNAIIQPKIFSDQMGISPLLVIAGVTIGGSIAGIVGMLVGVPLVAVLKLVFYDPFIKNRLQKQDIHVE